MRRRLILSMTAVTATVLLVAGIPLVVVVDRLARSEASTVLRRQAERIATDLATDIARDRVITGAQLEASVPRGDRLVLQTSQGRVVAGSEIDGAMIAVDVEPISGIRLRLETSASAVERRIDQALWSLGLLALAALGVSAALASLFAQRIAEPLDRLAESASRLGAGDFSERSPRSGMDEIDMIAASLDTAGARIAGLVAAERQFSSHASHQLRTAVTGLRLRLEELSATVDEPVAAAEVDAALEQADRLTDTIDDLLRLARTGRAGEVREFDLCAEVRLHVETARPAATRAGRNLVVVTPPEAVQACASPGAVGQALDVLIDNGVVHGAGAVTVTVERSGSHATVTVADDGAIDDADLFARPARSDGHGIGLRLARALVEGDGGRIDVVSTDPTTVRVTLPGAPSP